MPRPAEEPDAGGAPDALATAVYSELRRIAAAMLVGERRGHTLQPTALVHEAYLRLAGQDRSTWVDRGHFLCVASTMMRRILINHERDRVRIKRGGGRQRVGLESQLELADPSHDGASRDERLDLLALEDALRDLAGIDERKAMIVQLRMFAGLDLAETASAVGLSVTQVKRDWSFARAWLTMRLGGAA